MIFIPFCSILYTFPNWPEDQIQLFYHIWAYNNMFQMIVSKYYGACSFFFLAQQFYSNIVKQWLQFYIIMLGTDSGSYPDLF